MSLLLVGTVAGGLASGMMYHVFSTSIHARTAAITTTLHDCSAALIVPPPPGPQPAAARIVHRPFKELVEQRWNEEVEATWRAARDFDWRDLWKRTKGYAGDLQRQMRQSGS